jgi:hypothetical protein
MPIDYNKYPANWFTEIRPRILERAGNACEFCGLPNGAAGYRVKYQDLDGWKYIKGVLVPNRELFIKNHYLKGILIQMFKVSSKRVMIVLTIAHLDHDEENHAVTDDRLRALCQHCHLEYDIAEKQKRIIKKKNLHIP